MRIDGIWCLPVREFLHGIVPDRDLLTLAVTAKAGDGRLAAGACGSSGYPSETRLSRRAFPITDTDERLMAAAAIMGDRSQPNIG